MNKRIEFTVSRVICDLGRKGQTALLFRNRALFTVASRLICEFRDRASLAERERAEMVAVLKKEHGCAYCTHWRVCYTNPACDPCAKCNAGEGLPNWKWKGGVKL